MTCLIIPGDRYGREACIEMQRRGTMNFYNIYQPNQRQQKKKKKGAACFHRWSWLVPIEADIQGETLTDTQRLTPRRM